MGSLPLKAGVSTSPFTIFFPDGYQQPDADLYKIDCALDDSPMVYLYLLKQE